MDTPTYNGIDVPEWRCRRARDASIHRIGRAACRVVAAQYPVHAASTDGHAVFFSSAGGKANIVAACVIALLGGSSVEFWWPAILTGVAVWFYAKRPTATALVVAVLACTTLGRHQSQLLGARCSAGNCGRLAHRRELSALEVGVLCLLPGSSDGPVAHSHTDESRWLSFLHERNYS
ncbi:Conjugative transfer protein TrbP (IncF TraX) [Candidatus Burkholderia pumila]|uniref:Conjugative transfer protein TrbP (IncF TraX) n=1 Tax=Candidatus Burkholderia pumila TaxID=1090375 RepID=A0ABR5HKS6_9BURK|nr:Conjugative transfer protein TrbP (IncF TraX) [Candidatus Burkholderia pumila]